MTSFWKKTYTQHSLSFASPLIFEEKANLANVQVWRSLYDVLVSSRERAKIFFRQIADSSLATFRATFCSFVQQQAASERQRRF